MKRTLLILTLTTLCLSATPGCAWAEDGKEIAVNVTGTWTGVNYTSKVPGPHAVKLIFKQQGSKVTGSYCVSTGVCGKGEGKISGSRMEMQWKNVTPSCPGEYRNEYLVAEDQMTWKFSGQDCLGSEKGHGYAKKKAS